ncbi:hypothetical protein [Streptomyces sp. NPDC046261]|uniref:hypothetical protein n=1 Tax=Streptomyces sp. NPDC046261 TaxID=3157200 RepID=UPI00340AD674
MGELTAAAQPRITMAELRQAVTKVVPDSLEAYSQELAEVADEILRLRDFGPLNRFVASWQAKVMEQAGSGE